MRMRIAVALRQSYPSAICSPVLQLLDLAAGQHEWTYQVFRLTTDLHEGTCSLDSWKTSLARDLSLRLGSRGLDPKLDPLKPPDATRLGPCLTALGRARHWTSANPLGRSLQLIILRPVHPHAVVSVRQSQLSGPRYSLKLLLRILNGFWSSSAG